MIFKRQQYLGYVSIFALVLSVAWAGCDVADDPPEEASFFEAIVAGDVNEEIFGGASFATFTDQETGDDGIIIQLTTQEQQQRGAVLTGRFDDIPDEGTYEIVLLEIDEENEAESLFETLEVGELFGEYVTWQDPQDQNPSVFWSTTGIVEINAVSEERLEGHISFTARLQDEDGDVEEGPEIEFTGDFEADRGELTQ